MSLRQQRRDLARLNALMLRAEACEYEVQAVALDDSLPPSERVAKLEQARARARQAFQAHNAASVAYAQGYPSIAARPFTWLRSLFTRRVRA